MKETKVQSLCTDSRTTAETLDTNVAVCCISAAYIQSCACALNAVWWAAGCSWLTSSVEYRNRLTLPNLPGFSWPKGCLAHLNPFSFRHIRRSFVPLAFLSSHGVTKSPINLHNSSEPMINCVACILAKPYGKQAAVRTLCNPVGCQ